MFVERFLLFFYIYFLGMTFLLYKNIAVSIDFTFYVKYNMHWEKRKMIKKILNLCNKFLTKEIMLYLFFGVLTTLINILSFWLCSDVIFIGIENQDINITLSNIIAFILSVLFAFFTNKYYVFKDKEKSNTLSQLTHFTLSRVFTFTFEMVGILLFVNLLHVDKMISKIVFSFIVVILNYVFSKLLIFNK